MSDTRQLPEIVIYWAINHMHTNYFQVGGGCERDIKRFFEETQAKDTVIEYGWQECLLGDEHRAENTFIGFGYCKLTRKRLMRLADFHQLQLVFVDLLLSLNCL